MSRRTLGIAWNVVILLALGVYASQFGHIAATSTLFPRLITVPLAVLTLISLVRELLQRPQPGEAAPQSLTEAAPQSLTEAAAEGEADGTDRIDWRALLGAIGLAAVYIALWKLLGFVVDTVIFIAVVPLLYGFGPWRRRWPLTLGLGLAVAFLFVYLFHLGSGSILPGGFWNVG